MLDEDRDALSVGTRLERDDNALAGHNMVSQVRQRAAVEPQTGLGFEEVALAIGIHDHEGLNTNKVPGHFRHDVRDGIRFIRTARRTG